MEKQDTNLILVGIVAVVAIVGIIIMITSAGMSNLQYTDSAGQAAKALTAVDSESSEIISVAKCVDTDGGVNYYLKGTTTAGKTSKTDYCRDYNSSTLVEYYCKNSKIVSQDYTCPNGCIDGACKNQTTGYCGDGIITPPETCDIRVPYGLDCTDLGYDGGTLSCDSTCHFDTTQCFYNQTYPICGNGYIEMGEECDGTDLGGHICTDFLSYNGGTLSCFPPGTQNECTFDLRNCTISSSCTDSDGGINYAVRGTIYGYGTSGYFNMTDVCSGTYQLTEYFCSGSVANHTLWACQCGNGSCIPQLGNLYVTTVPTGASLYLGSVYKGLTPIMVSGLNAGYYATVKLTKTGYNDYNTGVTIVNGQTTTLSVNLSLANQSETGSWYVISNPSAASVYVDNVYKGVTPLTVGGLTVGTHQYKITKPGYYDYTGGQIVNAGQTTYINVTLVSTPKPDLIVEDIILSNSYGTILSNNIPAYTNLYAALKIKNVGVVTANVTSLYNLLNVTYANGSYRAQWTLNCPNMTYMIPPGASYTCPRGFIGNYSVATYNVWALVDKYNWILESNENNNLYGESIYVY